MNPTQERKRGTVPIPPRELVEAVRDGRAVCVVASGLSLDAGLPSWSDLLVALCAEAIQLHPEAERQIANALGQIRRDALLVAADELEMALSSPDELRRLVARQIQSKQEVEVDWKCIESITTQGGESSGPLFAKIGPIRPAEYLPTAAHRLVVGLGFRTIITTNYDRLLEMAADETSAFKSSISASSPYLPALLRDGPALLKLHGDFRTPQDIVLSRVHYDELRARDAVMEALRAHLSGNVVLWLGYGQRDPTFEPVVAEAYRRLGLNGGYAVMKKDSNTTMNRARQLGMQVIELARHEDLTEFLNKLAGECGQRVLVPFDLKQNSALDSGDHSIGVGPQLESNLAAIGCSGKFWAAREGGRRLWFEFRRSEADRLENEIREGDQIAQGSLRECGVLAMRGEAIRYSDVPRRVFHGVTLHETGISRATRLVIPPWGLRIAAGAGLSEATRACLDRGQLIVILDLSRVVFADSSGLGELVGVRKRVVEAGGRLILILPGSGARLRDLLSLTRVDLVFQIVETLEDALVLTRDGRL